MGNRGFYGFSHMRTTYRGPVEFTSYPLQYASILMWLSADAIAGLSDGDLVASWPDNVGLATVAQSNATYKPTYKTGVAGVHPAVRFTYGNYMTITGLTIGTNVTFMAVVQNKTQANTSSIHKPILAGVADAYGAGTTSWGFGYKKPGSDGFNVNQSSASASSYNLTPTEIMEVISFIKSSSDSVGYLYRNSGLYASGAFAGAGGSVAGYWLAGASSDSTRRYQGDIAEMLVWNTALTADERLYMERALMGKYGIL